MEVSSTNAWRAFLKRPENSSGPKTYPKSSRKLSSAFLKAPGKFGPVKSHVILPPKSYGSSHAPENVFGKLVGDKMAAAGAIFLKRFIQ